MRKNFVTENWLSLLILGGVVLILYVMYRIYEAALPAINVANQLSTSSAGQSLLNSSSTPAASAVATLLGQL
jgi:hypothetical protein